MFVFKSSCLLLLGLAVVILSETPYAGGSELELANANLVPLEEREGNEHNAEEQNPVFRQDTKCDGNSMCWNGGSCNNGVCKCLPGTSGPFCEKVEGCENQEEQQRRCGNPSEVYCVYNATSQKPYCRCKNLNFLYDSHYKTCKACSCGYNGKCSFVKGKQSCVCDSGYGLFIEQYRDESCAYCDCGMYSDGCIYYGYGNKVCKCKTGFSQNFLGRCSECDCGPKGNCTIELFDNKCKCDKGYTEKDGICQECDCGENGDCGWDDTTGDKKCNCKKGHGVKNGVCVDCKCFMENDPVGCSFTKDERKCSCPEGFEENNNSTCVDINECLNVTACPPDSDCKNTEGSYECTCKDGFRPTRESMNTTTDNPNEDASSTTASPDLDPKVVGCEDIDECVEYDVCTHNETTICQNTPGSYKCFCREGYSIPPYEKSAENGCRKNEPKKSYTTVYIVIGVILGVIIVGGLAYFAIRKFRR